MIRLERHTFAGGVTLECRRSGRPGAPRVMCLHGFPEAAFVWDELLLALGDEVDGLAPQQRGYAPSTAPAELAAYRPRALVADLVALVDHAFGTPAPLDLLVAHDWGGALAWNLSAQRPDLVRRLLILNAPHPGAFLRELRHSPAQQAASAYMNWLCRDDAAQRLAEGGFARLWRMLGSPAWLDAGTRARYEAVWAGGLQGALNWYRASPLRPPVPGTPAEANPIHALVLADEAVRVRVPTRVLWGEQDQALLPGLLDGLGDWVPDLRVDRVPEASHWIVHEQPARVLAVAREMLAGRG